MLETEFIPAAQKSSRLMVVLHGLGDSLAGFRWLPEALRLPWMNYLLTNAPDSYYGGFSWYDFAGDAGIGVERSRKLIFELLDAQPAKGYPTDQTILAGFSQGCLMTMDVGLRYPHHFAGLIGISGYIHEVDRSLKEFSGIAREQRFLVTHGRQDPIIPFAAAREQFLKLKAAGLDLSWHELDKAHTIAGEAELKILRDFITAGFPSKTEP